MDDETRAAMLAAMYQDTEPVTRPATATFRTRKIRVGAIEYEVPTIAYVEELERTIQQQRKILDRVLILLKQVNLRDRRRTIDNLQREMKNP